VNASRLATVLLVIVSAYVSAQLGSIVSGWEIVLTIGAGTGGVYLLRWYWWRINAWSEIAAMGAALVFSLTLRYLDPFTGSEAVKFAKTALSVTGGTTVVWILATYLTRPEPDDVLVRFYRKIRPHVSGWKPVATLAPDVPPTRDLGVNLASWLLGCTMVYCVLFGMGKLFLHEAGLGVVLLAVAAVSAALLYRNIIRTTSTEATKARL
jgi:hypothetical protein